MMNWIAFILLSAAVWFFSAALVGTFARVAWEVFRWWGPV